MLMRFSICFIFWSLLGSMGYTAAQDNSQDCSNNPARAWWDVLGYDLQVDFTDTLSRKIKGVCEITALVLDPNPDSMQIDLDMHLSLNTILYKGRALDFHRRGNAIVIKPDFSDLNRGDTFRIQLSYEGIPMESEHPPWSSGFIHTYDKKGQPWWAVACQRDGGSIWFPCKNFQGDEAESVRTRFTVPASLTAIGNGRLVGERASRDLKTKTFSWSVVNPINTYDITFYMGHYAHWHDTLDGLKGDLDLDFYVLKQNLGKGKKQFKQVKPMLRCFESRFGPYPFYEDGYKLVEAPYLGMEHQSAVAYGNHFEQGYLGKDRSESGVGLLFDFIIVHESGHEWFGNSITAYDKADSWIHEGFTSYAETLFAECMAGRERAFAYQRGKKRTIRNDRPVEGESNQCDEGTGDQYDKAGFLVHMIRLIMDNDERFFGMLREMNNRFYHRIVTGEDMEQFIGEYSGKDFSKIFDQYLRSPDLPVLQISKTGGHMLAYRWTHCVPGFDMPISWMDGSKQQWLRPTTLIQYLENSDLKQENQINSGFLVEIEMKNMKGQ
jgi:aminopeptidase N